MADEIYHKLARVLDTLPNGFPATESGVEIKLLKRIFTPEQADLFCYLRLTFETARQVAERTGSPLEGLERQLKDMGKAGQLFSINLGESGFSRCCPGFSGYMNFSSAGWIRNSHCWLKNTHRFSDSSFIPKLLN